MKKEEENSPLLNLSSSSLEERGKPLVGILRRFAAIKTRERGLARGCRLNERGCRVGRVTNGSE